MNIKSLLLGSAAALAAVSGAQAADAIVAAEPEPMEYVRVCDAFGTGFFYIPGTETCLKLGGYVRFQVNYNNDGNVDGQGVDKDWNARTRGLLNFDARTDTELGTLRSYISVRTWAEGDGAGGALEIDEAWLSLGGFRAGYGYNYWDNGLSGETDDLGSNRINQIGYEYKGDGFTAGVFLDELTRLYGENDFGANGLVPAGFAGVPFAVDYNDNDNLGIEAQVSGTFGAITASLLGGYDFAAEEGAIRGIVSANIGPGALSAAAVWSSGPNAYYDLAEWTVAAQYAAKFGKWTFTPAAQYWWNVGYSGVDGDWFGNDAWRAGLTVDYTIVSGLTAKATVNYTKVDGGFGGGTDDDNWSGFFRLQRTF